MDELSFWDRVKPLIKTQKMTQKQFARRLGISLNTLNGWIRHNRIPDTITTYDMAAILGVTLNFLLGGRETEIAEWRRRELAAKYTAANILEFNSRMHQEIRETHPPLMFI